MGNKLPTFGLNSSLRLERRILEDLKKRLKIGGVNGVLNDERIAVSSAFQTNLKLILQVRLGKISGHWDPYTIQKNLSFDPSIEDELQVNCKRLDKKSGPSLVFSLSKTKKIISMKNTFYYSPFYLHW